LTNIHEILSEIRLSKHHVRNLNTSFVIAWLLFMTRLALLKDVTALASLPLELCLQSFITSIL